jgi:hypothetical protein
MGYGNGGSDETGVRIGFASLAVDVDLFSYRFPGRRKSVNTSSGENVLLMDGGRVCC